MGSMERLIKIHSLDATRRRFGTAPRLAEWRGRVLNAKWDPGIQVYRVETQYLGRQVVFHVDPADAEEVTPYGSD